MQLKDSNESDHDVQNKVEEKFADVMKEIAAVKEDVGKGIVTENGSLSSFDLFRHNIDY